MKHFPCIGHSLHLVVGLFLVLLKTNNAKAADKTHDDDIEESEADTNIVPNIENEENENAFSDTFDNDYASQDTILKVHELVQDMRKFCRFVKNFTKCIEKLEDLQTRFYSDSNMKVLKVQMNVRTQGNSTLSMIKRMLLLMEPINDFIAFYKSPDGKKEFKGNKTKMPDIIPEK